MLGLRRDLLPRTPGAAARVFAVARSQLTIIYALKFLASLGYFLVSLTLSLYLTDEMALDDETAGGMYGVMGMLISLGTLPAGWVIDRIGVQRSIILGATLATASRLTLALTHSSSLCLAVLCAPLPLAEAFAVPSLSAAVGLLAQRAARQKRHSIAPVLVTVAEAAEAEAEAEAVAAAAAAATELTTEEEAAATKQAYGMFYTMMNVGLLSCGPLVDALRAHVSHPYRCTCLVSAGCGAITLVLAQRLDLSVMEKNHASYGAFANQSAVNLA